MPTPSQELQQSILTFVLDTYGQYKDLNKNRNNKLLEVYRAYSTYEEEKKADWLTNFKINKAHEIVERVLPRLIAKNPRWLVTPKTDDFYPEQELAPVDVNDPASVAQRKKELADRRKKTQDYSRAIQDYLEYVFDEYGFEKALRMLAKNVIVDGKGRAKICYKYEIVRNITEKEEPTTNEEGTVEKTEIKEEVVGEYPYIDVKSWTDVLTDPRFRTVRDMPAYIEMVSGVRLADLKRNEEYFNLDKLTEVAGLKSEDTDTYKSRVMAIAQVSSYTADAPIDKNALNLIKFYGLYDIEEDGNEKMYEFTIVDKLFLIGMKEITKIPFVEIDCFEDTQTNFSVGFVEPILGLQDELNFQKNSAINFINQSLNRTFIWSPNSGIDPRDLISKPYGVIPTTVDVPTAMANLQELPMRQLPSDYFQNQNDLERQIQGQTFTVDTSNQRGQQALTDTATGMRIEFFESNSVLDQVRKNFESGLSQLAYLLIQEAFENMEDNIALKKMGADEYWELNKELLRAAVQRYTIRVEVASSSFDDIENRRRDAMAFFNMLMQGAQAGVPVDMEEAVKDVIDTFEKRDKAKFIRPPELSQITQGMPTGSAKQDVQGVEAPRQPQGAIEVTQSVAQGDLQSLIPG